MLKGKTAVVTGGTRGIGFAVVKKFLENGAELRSGGPDRKPWKRRWKSCGQ